MNPALSARLSKYEYTNIIATRAQQLADNAPTTLEKLPPHPVTAVSIALEEFRQGRLPLKLKRKYSDNSTEVFPLDSFVVYK